MYGQITNCDIGFHYRKRKYNHRRRFLRTLEKGSDQLTNLVSRMKKSVIPSFNLCLRLANYLVLSLLYCSERRIVTCLSMPPNSITYPFQRIIRDYQALTRRVTARHILLPPNAEGVCLALKQKIRNDSNGKFVVKIFEDSAIQYSKDDTTNFRGGLIGELVPQGYCRSAVLDKACFQVPLGEVCGPIKSELGYHLLIVSERTNCPKLDGGNTKIIYDDVLQQARLVPSEQQNGGVDTQELVKDGVLFYLFVVTAGGFLAELAATVGSGFVGT